MKKIFTLYLFLISSVSFTQTITRGPEIGEVYFLGPTVTVFDQAIYRSTNFGQSIVCMDSLSQTNHLIEAISADKETGNIYFSTILEKLYHSENYGQAGTWVHKSNNVYPYLLSGVSNGYVFEYCIKHSEDFGNSFINHSLNGYFGVVISSELDVQDGIGYSILKVWGQNDTLYLMKSDDNFENLELQNKFVKYYEPLNWLSRGFDSGELFSFIENENSMIRFSNDYGYSWSTINMLYLNNYFDIGFTGGKQPGELYLLVTYIQLAGQIKHIYIYHSLDFGESFTIHHPFSFGNDPFYIGFSADTLFGSIPLTMQFSDQSSGEDLAWSWDFNNDGIVDSYSQNPTYTYYDTGYHSVKLKVTGSPNFNDSIVKLDYIYVSDTTTNVITKYSDFDIKTYPNPFSDQVNLIVKTNNDDFICTEMFIYNNEGRLVKVLPIIDYHGNNEIVFIWNGNDNNEIKQPAGIYYCRLNSEQDVSIKILKTN